MAVAGNDKVTWPEYNLRKRYGDRTYDAWFHDIKDPMAESRAKRRKYGGSRKLVATVPFPRPNIMKMRYCMSQNFASTGLQTPQWRANGMFDIEVGAISGEHQPMHYNQLTPVYDRWIVYGAKFIVRVTNMDTVPLLVVPYGMRNTAQAPTIDNACEQLGARKYVLAAQGAANSNMTVKRYVNCRKILGVSKPAYAGDNDNWGADAANPVNVVVFNLAMNAYDASAKNVRIDYTIIFYCKWSARQILVEN